MRFDSVNILEMPSSHTLTSASAALDAASQAWIDRLDVDAPDRQAAIKELHLLLLKAARFEVRRREAGLGHLGHDAREDLAQQSADDALMAVLRKLGDFRGESRFTTWAYKFALLEAAVKVRRRTWHGREIQLEPADWSTIADRQKTPQQDIESRELIGAIQQAIEHELTQHQRQVLVAITLNDVPIDVLAERLNSTRGALYKTLHDARAKLRRALAVQGHDLDRHTGGAPS